MYIYIYIYVYTHITVVDALVVLQPDGKKP